MKKSYSIRRLAAQDARQKLAFTLVEVLVVIVIMGLLGALLFPLGGKIRESAKSMKCVSNLRQIGVGLNGFANDHGNKFPRGYSSVSVPKDLSTWMTKVAPYVGVFEPMGSPPLPRAVGLFMCPSLPDTAAKDRKVGYFYNPQITTGVWNYNRSIMPPSKLLLIVEGLPANSDTLKTIGVTEHRHPGNTANFLYVDGHVETMGELLPSDDPRWGLTHDAQ